jgi:hypothetical protein
VPYITTGKAIISYILPKAFPKIFNCLRALKRTHRYLFGITFISIFCIIACLYSCFCYTKKLDSKRHNEILAMRASFDSQMIAIKNNMEDDFWIRYGVMRKLKGLLRNIYSQVNFDDKGALTVLRLAPTYELKGQVLDSVWRDKQGIHQCQEEKDCRSITENFMMSAAECETILKRISHTEHQCGIVDIEELSVCHQLLDGLQKMGENHDTFYLCAQPSISGKSYYAVAFFGLTKKYGNAELPRLNEMFNKIYNLLKQQ